MKHKKLPGLSQVLLQLVLWRLFLPLLAVWFAAICIAGYLLLQSLNLQQQQNVKSTAQVVDRYLEQGARILDAVARVAENKSPQDMTAFMQGTWEAYRHFDTIYYLDENLKIVRLVPFEKMYLGLDMSNLPDFQKIGDQNGITISRPFISLRTGNPTVYLTRLLAKGGWVVGELNLGAMQAEVTSGQRPFGDKEDVYILDQSGMLLAHPLSALVKQRTNLSNFEIFHQGLNRDISLIYNFEGRLYWGYSTRVSRVGWVIVDHVPLATLLGPYTMTLGMTVLVTLAIWLALMWILRKKLQRNIVEPLVSLRQSTDALAMGDFARVNALGSSATDFAELNGLANDFQHMSETLETRQTELRESEEQYRSLFEGVPVGLFRLSAAGCILDANLTCSRILRFPEREILMRVNLYDLLVMPRESERWQMLAEQEQATYNETEIRCYDGTIIWGLIRCRTIRGDDNQVLYYDGSMTDITERKQAEEALHRAHEELERLVDERTRELKILNEELRALSLRDGLTGIANRRYFDEYMEREWQRAKREIRPIALLMVDIDCFKAYNDTYGHLAGDECLKKIADALKSVARRDADMVARYGGEEFAFVLPNTDRCGAVMIGEKLKFAVDKLGIKHERSSVSHIVTVSVGVAIATPQRESALEVIISKADQALYQAKREGRNRLKVAEVS